MFALLIKMLCFEFVIVEGDSMLPAISQGMVLIVNRVAYGFRFPWMEKYLVSWKMPQKDDIVVFITPQGHTAVKRCGDIVDETFFMAFGDNKNDSFDSRAYGPVPIDNILGQVIGNYR